MTLLAEFQVGRTDGWLYATGSGLSTSYGKAPPSAGPFYCSMRRIGTSRA